MFIVVPNLLRGDRMDSKEFLGQTFEINKRINLIEKELQALNEIRKKYPNQIINSEIKTDLEHILKLSLDDLIKYKTKIYTLIKTVPDATVQCVLEYRYITEMKFDDIADRLFYSRRQVMRYYNQGLDYITKILEQANV